MTTSQALNLIMMGFTKEAAGLIVYAQKVDEALTNRYMMLLTAYQSLQLQSGSLEGQVANFQTELDQTRTELIQTKAHLNQIDTQVQSDVVVRLNSLASLLGDIIVLNSLKTSTPMPGSNPATQSLP